ncbi:substrate-binding domain-containing protein [Streptomyces tsukubensis]|uniref:LacI family transcriptional regulator n=1 Tax=Streptomyces tsukubensis TaxID=83656 RepID=A0A1V4AFV4_9ACTN|nr:substrate-binding domain-containing protein [Streptomyces tsukubensis]OON82567.1 LacI family transcriptional regulator [Streptomyces tsukubensis]
MREPVELRRRRILAVVRSRGSARVSDLADELKVSVVTVRRDIEELERAGQLVRGHGVVRSVVPIQRAAPEAVPEDGHTVALMVPERHSYLFETLHGARTVLEEAGLRIALHIVPRRAAAERPMVEAALAGGASGLLIAPNWRSLESEEADYGWLAELDVPTVLMERRPRPGSRLHALDSVCSDHWYGMHLAVDHLISLGHRRIILAVRDDSPTARALRAAFIEIAVTRTEVEDWTVVLSSPEAGPDLSAGPVYPALDLPALLAERGSTGVVLHGDVDAVIQVQRLAEAGLRVPEDCSVVAYDDVVAALSSTPLTAVAPPKTQIGAAAAELMLYRLGRLAEDAGESATEPVRRVELLPELKVRGSAQAPAKSR